MRRAVPQRPHLLQRLRHRRRRKLHQLRWRYMEDDGGRQLVFGHMGAGRKRRHHPERVPRRDHHPDSHRGQRRIPVCGRGEAGHPLLPEQGGGTGRHAGVHRKPAEHRYGLSGIRRLEEESVRRKLLPAAGDDLVQGRRGQLRQGRLRSGQLRLSPRPERRRMGRIRSLRRIQGDRRSILHR